MLIEVKKMSIKIKSVKEKEEIKNRNHKNT